MSDGQESAFLCHLGTDALGAEITKTLKGWLISLEEKLFLEMVETPDGYNFEDYSHNNGSEYICLKIVFQQLLKWLRRLLPVSSIAHVAVGKGVGKIGRNFEAVRRGGKCWCD